MDHAIGSLDSVQGELATALWKLQAANRELTAWLDQLKWHFSSVRAPETALQERMKSNLKNYIKTIFNRVKQRTKLY